MNGHYHYNGEEYCENCLPVSTEEADFDYGEQDSPANCCVCHRPLDYSLTKEGVSYVIEALIDELNSGPEQWNQIHDCYKGTYYDGCRHVEILRDWAKDLKYYGGLSPAEEFLIRHFLEVTKRKVNEDQN